MKRIILIDDDPSFRFIIRTILKKIDMTSVEFFEAESGQDGIEIITHEVSRKSKVPILVLLDLNLPIMDGWDVLEELEQKRMQEHANLKVYMLSSSINPLEISRAQDHILVKDFLSKPLSRELLANLIES